MFDFYILAIYFLARGIIIAPVLQGVGIYMATFYGNPPSGVVSVNGNILENGQSIPLRTGIYTIQAIPKTNWNFVQWKLTIINGNANIQHPNQNPTTLFINGTIIVNATYAYTLPTTSTTSTSTSSSTSTSTSISYSTSYSTSYTTSQTYTVTYTTTSITSTIKHNTQLTLSVSPGTTVQVGQPITYSGKLTDYTVGNSPISGAEIDICEYDGVPYHCFFCAYTNANGKYSCQEIYYYSTYFNVYAYYAGSSYYTSASSTTYGITVV